jgi:flagellin-like hook-associated protein FlgL
MKHSQQPVVTVDGIQRFQENPIVTYLLKQSGITMNDLAVIGFDEDDEAHFAQLIGYSVSGWGDLSYVSDEMWSEMDAAQAKRASIQTETQQQRAIEEIDNALAALGTLRATLTGES